MYNDPFASLHVKEFQFFLAGRFFFVTGLRMLGTIVAWWLYEITRDPFAIGLLGLAEVIPAVGLALYAGHVIDHTERTKIVRRSVLFYGLVIFLIVMISTDWIQLHVAQKYWVGLIYALIFATGAIRAFSGAAFPSLMGQIVPMNIMTNAITLNNGTFLTAAIIGHAGGGLLIAWLGIQGALWVAFVFVLTASIVVFQIRSKPMPETSGYSGTWESVKEGLRFVYKTKELLASMTLDLFAVLFGGAVAVVPAFAKDILHVGPTGFGWLNAASDIGSMITVIGLTIFPLKKKQGKVLLVAVAGFGISIIVFGLSRSYVLSFIALLCSGLLDGFSAIIRGTIAQLLTPNEIKGRVMSVNSMFINSSNEFGQFESGLAAKVMGLVPSVIFGGSMTLVIVWMTWWKAPKLRKLHY